LRISPQPESQGVSQRWHRRVVSMRKHLNAGTRNREDGGGNLRVPFPDRVPVACG
jgi:hypothetical protein